MHIADCLRTGKIFPLVFLAVSLILMPQPSLALAEDPVPVKVRASFEKFSKVWMARLEQVNRDNNLAVKPETVAPGRVVGRYLRYGPDCTREVRATGSKTTPFVGILRYSQRTMEKEGETIPKMKDNPASASGEIQVMEIFRYTGGRWVY